MRDELPHDIQNCFELGATRFGKAIDALDFPNAGKDSPAAEANALFSVACCLGSLPEPFHMYFEAATTKGRIDMLGFDGRTAIAVEAKAFGDINKSADSVMSDLERLREFTPLLTKSLVDNLQPNTWWDEAKSRWAIALISSFRGREVAEAWLADEEREFMDQMKSYKKKKTDQPRFDADGNAVGFLALYRKIPISLRGAYLITSAKRWEGCGEGWLLWAAIPLSTSEVPKSA